MLVCEHGLYKVEHITDNYSKANQMKTKLNIIPQKIMHLCTYSPKNTNDTTIPLVKGKNQGNQD